MIYPQFIIINKAIEIKEDRCKLTFKTISNMLLVILVVLTKILPLHLVKIITLTTPILINLILSKGNVLMINIGEAKCITL